MPFPKLSKKRAIEYLETLLARYDKGWEKFEAQVPGGGRAWYEDVTLAMERIYGGNSREYASFSRLFSGPPWGKDLSKVFFFLRGRIEDIAYWEDDAAAETGEIPPKVQSKIPNPQPSTDSVPSNGDKGQRVFVVHGRDERLRSGVFTFLRSVGLQPLEFGEARQLTGKPMPYVGEILEAAFRYAQAVVVLLTPDDEAKLRSDLVGADDPIFEKELSGQPRPNVLFEAGMALVTHPDETVLVQFGNVRPFSDVAGRHILHMNNSVVKRQDLAQRLEAARCLVNIKGTDWHTSGDLMPPDVSASSNTVLSPAKPMQDLLTVTAMRQLKNSSLAKYPSFGVDSAMTLVPCPYPDRGWKLSDPQVDLRTTTAQFVFPKDQQEQYLAYKAENYEAKKFVDDRNLLMLTKTPRVFTDAPTLILEVKEVLFSKVLFFREVLLRTVPDLWGNTLDDLMSGKPISFPHGMSMQMVVGTRDGQVLITERSHTTEWYGGHWSCSMEENLSVKDFAHRPQGAEPVRNWAKRALDEEFGLREGDYSVENVRILSVFVESNPDADVLNICLCAVVLLEMESEALSARLRSKPRKDHEFSDFRLVSYEEMFGELIQPTRKYHPTSRYRMALALVQREGQASFAQRF
ncbi:MAG: nucleotide-binding protein [Acidobacteriia bacterium]|nr:nucleotide-binding protein [Terriglobia bacterium]